ncbi:MAG: glycosyl hydrolase 108 family protein [Chromatiaceae bacterium]
MSHFPRCINYVLAAEGGYVNDPNDPGGETKFGISKRSYPDLDIKLITQDQAIALYERDFWTPIQGDDLPPGLDLLILDHAINAGVGASVRLVQRITGCALDGQLGPVTLAAIAARNPEKMIEEFSDTRLAFYRSLPGWRHYSVGWTRRVQRMRRFALAMARELNPVSS